MARTENGRRLFPMVVDELAISSPERPYVDIASSADLSDLRTISFGRFANAANRAAWWMEEKLGRGEEYPRTAYAGPQDLRYMILIVAGVKTGNIVYLPSLRNSQEAHLSVLDSYKCKTFLLSDDTQIRKTLAPVLEARQFNVIEVPPLAFFLDSTPVPVYEWKRDFDEYKARPLVGLHTSGSTGIPKAIAVPHACYSGIDAYNDLPDLGYPPLLEHAWKDRKTYALFPFFHAAAVFNFFMAPFYNMHLVLAPPVPPSAQISADLINRTSPDCVIMPPAILVDMAHEPDYLKVLAKLKHISFGGGPMPSDAGRKIAKHTQIQSLIGTSEVGMYVLAELPSEDIPYIQIFPEVMGAEFRPHTDNLYEMVLVRDAKLEKFQIIFQTFPNLDEYPTKDLYSKHPKKEGLWLWEGRVDDIITYSTGEKFNPSTMQDIIDGHPLVSSSVVYGQTKPQSSLLLEPTKPITTPNAKEEMINAVWPTIQRANEKSPSYARIMKDMIWITRPDGPLPRAGKGTVQKPMATKMYEAELDKLYDDVDNETPMGMNGHSGGENYRQELASRILDIVANATDLGKISPNDNLFDLGFDSLGALALTRELRRLASRNGMKSNIAPRDIYRNPTATSLAAVLLGSKTVEQQEEEDLQSLYEKFTADLPITARFAEPHANGPKTVILTGSTGSLGSYLLDKLLADTSVEEVICLNRSADARERQLQSRSEKGLNASFDLKPVTFLQVDIAKPYFGLKTSDYRNLLSKVTHIIHNAWQVDFNVSTAQLAKTHVKGTREVIDFAARSKHDAFIFFISSISTIMGESLQRAPSVKETLYKDWNAAALTGYGQSKMLAERILATAAEECGTRCAICRVGQVAGPSTKTGKWKEVEWLPSIVFSSKYLDALPSTLGYSENVDWIPIDKMAQCIVELAFSSQDFPQNTETPPGAPAIYHLVNPQTTPWARLLPQVEKALDVPSVPVEQWLQKVEQSGAESAKQNPAYKLLDTYHTMLANAVAPSIETTKTVQRSPTLSRLKAIDPALMQNWLRQWDLIAV